MQIRQCVVSHANWQAMNLSVLQDFEAHLVLVFACLEALEALSEADVLRQWQPHAQWVGCSTAGEISDQGVADGSVVLTALRFDEPAFRVVSTRLHGMADSTAAGQRLALQLHDPALRHVLVLGQGADINGSALVRGLTESVSSDVLVTGGLAGDGGRFTGSRVLGPHGVSGDDLVAIGFDGPSWRITHGSLGGWQRFGPIRTVTRCQGNVLYELDGESALAIYKRYLGDYAAQLPASGLLFPWSVLSSDPHKEGLTRTILGIDEAQGGLILAGDVPQGGHMQLMKASVDALVDAAQEAAQAAIDGQVGDHTALALLISCVGRKLVMGARVDEEVEAVVKAFGNSHTTFAGFYSNGEISPHIGAMDCKLHNQTMTITLLSQSCLVEPHLSDCA
jgi:hypothetical protein